VLTWFKRKIHVRNALEKQKKKKKNTCKFDENQLLNNHKMIDKLGWNMNKINSTKSI
jgi:hypothetical protein